MYVLVNTANEYMLLNTDTKSTVKSNFAIKQSCSMICRICHNGLLHSEILKEKATAVGKVLQNLALW